MLRRFLMLAAGLAFLAASASWGGPDSGTPQITGTVTYLQRGALPADTIVVVRLQDVSFQDVQPARIIAEQEILAAGQQVPIPFRLPYAEADIDPAHSYAVLAMISAGDKMLFASTASYPVITNGAPKHVEILVQPVADPSAAHTTKQRSGRAKNSTSAELLGTEWKLVGLAGEAGADVSDGHGANLVLHEEGETLSGSSGCNRLVGTFKLHGHALYFEPVGLTRMACPEPVMKQEKAFLDALEATTRYVLSGDTLELRKDEQSLATFRTSPESGPASEAADMTDSPSGGGVHDKGPDRWLGQWNGPEGTYLILTKNGDQYSVEIRSLDGVQTYDGVASGDRIRFLREGTAETIHAEKGDETGMKWLAGKKNCLVIKVGEGFCRD
jgi:putative lipoprotein